MTYDMPAQVMTSPTSSHHLCRHETSSNVISKLSKITLERKEIRSRGWSQCVYLVNAHIVTCNLTYFTGHRMTLNWDQIFNYFLVWPDLGFGTGLEKSWRLRSPGLENVDSSVHTFGEAGPDVFRKWALSENSESYPVFFFGFGGGHLVCPFNESLPPSKSDHYFVRFFLVKLDSFRKMDFLSDSFRIKNTLIFSFWRGHIGPLEGLVPPFLKPLVKSCSGRVLILPEEAKSDTVRLGTS